MTRLIAAGLLISAGILNSCEPAVTFDQPQPDGVKSLASFPQRLQGTYVAADGASIVTVNDKLVTRHYDFDVKEHKDSLGASYTLAGDTLIDQDNGTREKVVVRGDTVIQRANWTDTLFNISADNILKKFKGYYFLNNRHGESSWEVKKLSLKKSVLTVGRISDEEDIRRLKEITEVTSDTIPTRFTLTRRQFKSFIRQEGFGEEETFNRVATNGR